MKTIYKDNQTGITVIGGQNDVLDFAKTCEEYDRGKMQWIRDLKNLGYKAAHPSADWWSYIIRLESPHFVNGEIAVGDKIMVGYYNCSNNAAIEITSVHKDWRGVFYKFVTCTPLVNKSNEKWSLISFFEAIIKW